MPMTFLVNGREVTAEQFQAQAEKKKPKPVREQKGYHKGFRVVGHAPGAVEEAYHAHEKAIHDYRKESPARRAEMASKSQNRGMRTSGAGTRRKPPYVQSRMKSTRQLNSAPTWLEMTDGKT